MWGSQRNRANEAEAARDEALERAERLEQELDSARAQRDSARADRQELKDRYDPPVTVRRVVSSGFESNRRNH